MTQPLETTETKTTQVSMICTAALFLPGTGAVIFWSVTPMTVLSGGIRRVFGAVAISGIGCLIMNLYPVSASKFEF